MKLNKEFILKNLMGIICAVIILALFLPFMSVKAEVSVGGFGGGSADQSMNGFSLVTDGGFFGFAFILCLVAVAASCLLSATQNAKSGKRRDKPKLSGINQHKADCYAVCCVSQVVYPARFSKVSCQKNRCVFASIFLYLLKRRSILNNRFKLF